MKFRSLKDLTFSPGLYLIVSRILLLTHLFKISTVAFSQQSEFRLGLDDSSWISRYTMVWSTFPATSRYQGAIMAFPAFASITSTLFLGESTTSPRLYQYEIFWLFGYARFHLYFIFFHLIIQPPVVHGHLPMSS